MNKQLINKHKPEFKISDWINISGPTGTFVDQISNINTDTYTLSGTAVCYKSQATLWKPKPGEWCIVDNSENEDIHISFMVHQWEPNSKWTPIPYTGPLPHFIKEN